MQTWRRLVTLMALSTCIMLLVATVAFAGKVYYQGSSSVQYDNNTNVRACDGQADGLQAYSRHVSFSGVEGYTYDTTGANDGLCGNSGNYSAGIRIHNICESRPAFPDGCSDYSNHG